VRREDNSTYYKLLSFFYAQTGCPCVLNSSFNMHRESIVNTPEEMIRDLLISGLDAVYIGPYRVTRKT
jgi:carbamoyltransferase